MNITFKDIEDSGSRFNESKLNEFEELLDWSILTVMVRLLRSRQRRSDFDVRTFVPLLIRRGMFVKPGSYFESKKALTFCLVRNSFKKSKPAGWHMYARQMRVITMLPSWIGKLTPKYKDLGKIVYVISSVMSLIVTQTFFNTTTRKIKAPIQQSIMLKPL